MMRRSCRRTENASNPSGRTDEEKNEYEDDCCNCFNRLFFVDGLLADATTVEQRARTHGGSCAIERL